jgi:hypothetical protein
VKGVEVNPVGRPLVLIAVIRAHPKLAGRDTGEPGNQFLGHQGAQKVYCPP